MPSNWQQHGFGHYQYGYDRGPRSDDHAVYRRSFDVPAAWSGKSVRLVFDGVMTDALVKVNGVVAGPVHQGGFNRFGFDIAALLKPGARNEVEVAVSEVSAAKDTDIAERWGDYWALSGIYRPVWLEVAPAESITHVAIDARANGDIAVDATLGAVRTATRLVAQVRTKAGVAVGPPFATALPAGGTGRIRLSGHVDGPRLWTAETPELHDLDVTLWNGDAPVHRVRTRFGFRTFEVREGDGLYLNGTRIMLKGVNRHSFRPDTGRALSRADAYADARMLRDLNMNAVRLSHYSPEEAFLEAADELGLYVIDELTGWQHAHDTDVGRKLVRELVERDVNHPAILLWTNGNEGGWNRALDGDFGLYDPQNRRVLHPWELFGGIDTKHYPRYGDLVRRLGGASLVMPTEFLHALYDGGGGAGLDDYWNAITGSPRGAGGFIWNLADEGIARHDRGGAIDTAATLASGTVRGAVIAPHADGIVTLPPRPAGSDALAVTVRRDGRDLLTRVWSVVPTRVALPSASRIGLPRVERGDQALSLVAGSTRATIDPSTGLLTAFRHGHTTSMLANGPRLVFARPAAEKSEPVFTATAATAGDVYRPARPGMANILDIDTGMTAEDGWGGFTVQVSPDGDHWTTIFTGARTARDGTRYPFAPQPVAAVRIVDPTGARRPPSIRTVRLGYEADRFPAPVMPPVARATSGAGRDPVTGRATAWVDVPGAGGLRQARWTLDDHGILTLDYAYRLSGPMLYHGIGFDAPGGIAAVTGLVRGPWPVWQNRLRGPALGVHRIAATGEAGIPAPDGAGYFADPRWLRLDAGQGSLVIRNQGGAPYAQIGARLADLPSTSVDFPHAEIGFLAAIPAMGAKFQPADTTGPAGLPSFATGDYRGRLVFDPMPARRQR